jgi:uncharacterized protein YxjI
MEVYEITQALMTVGTVYNVRRPRSEELLYTIKGELTSATPKFHLVKDGPDKPLADLSGNFIKTKYEISKDGKAVAALSFPAVAFKKTLTLTVDGKAFEADGGVFKGIFQCKDEGGDLVLEIAKELSIRDTFVVKTNERLPLEVCLLSAVAIHSRFYEMV